MIDIIPTEQTPEKSMRLLRLRYGDYFLSGRRIRWYSKVLKLKAEQAYRTYVVSYRQIYAWVRKHEGKEADVLKSAEVQMFDTEDAPSC